MALMRKIGDGAGAGLNAAQIAFLKDEDRDSPVTLTSNTIVGLVTSEKTRADSSKAPYSLPQQPTVQIRRG